MVISLRDVALRCLGLEGNFSIVEDFFGYRRLIREPDSLLAQLKLLSRGKHIHVNVIRVAFDMWLPNHFRTTERGLRKLREIFAQVDLGVARIKYHNITSAQAPGREHINDDCEASDLTNEFTIHNNGMDLFLVFTYAGATWGYSAIDGVCDKKDHWHSTISGSVVAIDDAGQKIGTVIAHELAHYLGLEHYYDYMEMKTCLDNGDSFSTCLGKQPETAMDRLMFPRQSTISDIITKSEGNTMKKHCLTFDCTSR